MRTVCIVTGTRADWGLLSPIARSLAEAPDVALRIIATNMHLSPRYGNTYKEILADGFKIHCHVPLLDSSDSAADTVRSMSIALRGMADAFEELRPDVVVILGDRTEMLEVASAALIFCTPIVHIAGGEISEGAYDDSIRHAITEMSHIHLTETEEYRRRVIQLGEDPAHVINTGAIGVHNILHTQLLDHDEIERQVGCAIGPDTLVVTFHPATLDAGEPAEQCRALLQALDDHSRCNFIFTYPNNDTNGQAIISAIEEYVGAHRNRAVVFPSLGRLRYLSVLRYAGGVVGNSSSGIIEVPSMGIPTLNIGSRQRGRIAAPSVVHCDPTREAISAGLDTILSPEHRAIAARKDNPYYRPDTLRLITDAIRLTPLEGITIKHFHDINAQL